MKTALLFFIALFATVANAHWSKIPSKEFQISPPPSQGSRAYRQDFATLLEYQESRTEEQCSLANSQRWPTFELLFNDPTILRANEFSKVEELMERVANFTERVAGYFKDKFGRPRPYNVDSNIEPCIPRVSGATSYPSSHAAVSYASACILGEIFPRKKAALIKYGAELGELRVVVGVHHPSDVRAGQRLAQDICDRLLAEEDFISEIEMLR